MKQKGNQALRYARLIAKAISVPFAVAGVFLFIVQFSPMYIGKGILFGLFFAGGIFWGLDTLWSTLEDWREIAKEIEEHRSANPG